MAVAAGTGYHQQPGLDSCGGVEAWIEAFQNPLVQILTCSFLLTLDQ